MSETSNAAGRITSLLDANSFVEIGGMVTARSTDFNLNAEKSPSDGVITGYGTIDGNVVYIYSQDVSVLGGTVGEMHAKKISRIYDLAMKTGSPVIGLIDSNGIRLEESSDALNALGEIYAKETLASGLVPQITAVFGNCGGGLSLISALSDFTFLVSDSAKLFVNAPDSIQGNSSDKLDTSSPEFQMKEGNADFAGTEGEVLQEIRRLVDLLPLNDEDEGESLEVDQAELNRAVTGFASYTDALDQVKALADGYAVFEAKKDFAPSMITALIRLGGSTVGVVANREAELRAKGMEKAAGFIKFCDAFNIPVLTLASAVSVYHGKCTEKLAQKAGAELAYAYADASVPKVTVVTGKSYGTAYVLLGSKALGADMVYAYETSEIGTMDAKMAAKIIAADSDAETINRTAKEYSALQQSASSAAGRGLVDTIISDADTRKYVIGAFETLYTKREDRPDKKHGTV